MNVSSVIIKIVADMLYQRKRIHRQQLLRELCSVRLGVVPDQGAVLVEGASEGASEAVPPEVEEQAEDGKREDSSLWTAGSKSKGSRH